MSVLLFNLIRNWHGEYSTKEPYQIIELVDKTHPIRGYSCCDENGRTNCLPHSDPNGECWFLPANKDTELAFIGKKKYIRGKELFVVKKDPDCEGELQELIKEKKSKCKK